jgi:hypothetical protein
MEGSSPEHVGEKPRERSRLQRTLLRVAVSATICAVAFGSMFYWAARVGLGQDWQYFSSLSLVAKSAMFEYGVLPVHQPWGCGGLDLLSNPQNRFFSPFFVFDLFLPLWLSNTGVVATLGILGWWGARELFLHFGVGLLPAAVVATVWICGSWFGLHFAEGHVPYAAMQLLPAVWWLMMRLESRKHVTALFAVLAWFLLEGAIYAFIFSIFLFFTGLLTRTVSVSHVWALLGRSRLSHTCVCMTAFSLLAAPKLYPVLSQISGRTPMLDFFRMPLSLVLRALFDPWQELQSFKPDARHEMFWGFHEYGTYLSPLGLFLILAFVLGRPGGFRAKPAVLVLAGFFWFWVGSGWGGDVNPWRLFQALPLLNNAHVQSRTFILMFLLFCVLLAAALDALKERRALILGFACVFLFEAAIVRNAAWIRPPWKNHGFARLDSELIQSRTIEYTAPFIWNTHEYLQRGLGSKTCYEPANVLPYSAFDSSDPSYRGEVFLEDSQAGSVQQVEISPGRIVIDYDLQKPTSIIVNQRLLYHWRVVRGAATINSWGAFSPAGLIQVTPTMEMRGQIELRYQPPWLWALFVSWLLGIGVFAVLFWSNFFALRVPRGHV